MNLVAALRPMLFAGLALFVAACTPPPPAGFERHDDRYQRCGARSQPIDDSKAVAFSGTVYNKLDAAPVDGPVDLVLIDGEGQLVKLQFLICTRCPPSTTELATYDRIRTAQRGDCVRVSGSRLADGRISIDTFVRHDPDASSP